MENKEAEVKNLRAQLAIYKKLYEETEAQCRYRKYATDEIVEQLNEHFSWSNDRNTVTILLTKDKWHYVYNTLNTGHKPCHNIQDTLNKVQLLKDTLKLLE